MKSEVAAGTAPPNFGATSGAGSTGARVINDKAGTRRSRRRTRDPELAVHRKALVEGFQRRMAERYGIEVIRERFGRDTIPATAIYSMAGEPGSEYYRWLTGQLRDGSPTQKNIESVLSADTLPRKPRSNPSS